MLRLLGILRQDDPRPLHLLVAAAKLQGEMRVPHQKQKIERQLLVLLGQENPEDVANLSLLLPPVVVKQQIEPVECNQYAQLLAAELLAGGRGIKPLPRDSQGVL